MSPYVRLAESVKPEDARWVYRQRKCNGGKGFSSSAKAVNHSTNSTANILYQAVR